MTDAPRRPRLFLVDGTALAYRAFFAMGRSGLSTSSGEPTGAVFGVANTLWSLLAEFRPEYMAVVFDTAAPTFRHEEYAEYKANREEMPSDLASQLPRLSEMVKAWPLVHLAVDGVEADDVMGSYAVQLAGPDLEVVLVTADKDFCQLVNDNVFILNPGRGGPAKVEAHRLDAKGVEAKFGVPPAQVIDVLALMGDTSDNVPGVPGIGEKSAAQLIREFGSLEALLGSIDKVSRKSWAEKLTTWAEQARLSRRLVTIKTDCPLPASLAEMAVGKPAPSLAEFFQRMEFGRLTRQATEAAGLTTAGLVESLAPAAVRESGPEPAAPTAMGATMDLFAPPGAEGTMVAAPAGPWLTEPPPTDAEYRLADDERALVRLAAELRAAPGYVSIDTETTGLDPMRAALVGLSFSTVGKTGWYVPVGHVEGPNVSLEQVRTHLGPVLADPSVKKVGQNIKYDLVVLDRHQLPVAGVAFDTMVASYLIDAERSHKLDNLAHDELGYRMVPITDLIGKGQKQRTFADVPVPLAVRYAAEDADITLRLSDLFLPRLAERELESLFRDIEMPLLLVLKEMEETGIALDVPFLNAMSERLGREIAKLESFAHETAGETFNLNSPIQLGKLLFEKLKLPAGRKTKTGWSTDSETLEDLVPQHALPKLILDYRQLAKLKSTYVDALPRLVHPDTGRVHSCFNQTVAATGRLSSSDPNLQNIPIRTELGREVRRAFVAGGPGMSLISADYSQIELRIMAHLSGDANLNDYFRRGVDVHRETAASIFGVPAAEVTGEQRAQAKTVNFGIMYGQGPVGLSRQIGITREAAKQFIAAYKAQFPGVTTFLDRTVREATSSGYVTTLMKRRRYLPNLLSGEGRFRAEAERMAINTPIQGTAADLIKLAMLSVDRELKDRYPRARLLLQVHDELVLEAPDAEAEAVAATVRSAMENAVTLSVPVVVDVGVGRDWAGIH
ncbi:MAG TPA: DNA polymerase I [Candidatus Eisenbacteria bacterium]